MAKTHHFSATITWTGNRGTGTAHYCDYGREHTIRMEGKPDLAGSSAPVFRGDASRHNPEDLMVAALSACHMLWYLHFAAVRGVIILADEDRAEAVLETASDGRGRFVNATLHPRVTISAASDSQLAAELHNEAHQFCFVANSVNFPVIHVPEILRGSE